HPPSLPSFPTRRSSDLDHSHRPAASAPLHDEDDARILRLQGAPHRGNPRRGDEGGPDGGGITVKLPALDPQAVPVVRGSGYPERSEEHTSELQSRSDLV